MDNKFLYSTVIDNRNCAQWNKIYKLQNKYNKKVINKFSALPDVFWCRLMFGHQLFKLEFEITGLILGQGKHN